MLPIHDLAWFLSAALLLNLTPGPDMLYVAGTAVTHGRRVGVAAALGIGLGCLVHVALAALGVSALIVASGWGFDALKIAGAAYLVFLGVILWRRPAASAAAAHTTPSTRVTTASALAQGALINALNPKVALFFLALLPQFIDASAPEGQAWAFVALGLLFDLGGTVVNLIVAVVAAGAGRRLGAAGGRAGLWWRRVTGTLFVALGLRLALGSR